MKWLCWLSPGGRGWEGDLCLIQSSSAEQHISGDYGESRGGGEGRVVVGEGSPN